MYHYDCGVVLDTRGNNDRGSREPLNDHLTMYLLMIMHWGAMSMATLLLPNAHAQLYQDVISSRAKEPLIRFRADQLWLREFIQQRVSGSWLYMQMRMETTGADVAQLLAETLMRYHEQYWADPQLRCGCLGSGVTSSDDNDAWFLTFDDVTSFVSCCLLGCRNTFQRTFDSQAPLVAYETAVQQRCFVPCRSHEARQALRARLDAVLDGRKAAVSCCLVLCLIQSGKEAACVTRCAFLPARRVVAIAGAGRKVGSPLACGLGACWQDG